MPTGDCCRKRRLSATASPKQSAPTHRVSTSPAAALACDCCALGPSSVPMSRAASFSGPRRSMPRRTDAQQRFASVAHSPSRSRVRVQTRRLRDTDRGTARAVRDNARARWEERTSVVDGNDARGARGEASVVADGSGPAAHVEPASPPHDARRHLVRLRAMLRKNGGRVSRGAEVRLSTTLNDSATWPRGGPFSREPWLRSRACPSVARGQLQSLVRPRALMVQSPSSNASTLRGMTAQVPMTLPSHSAT